MNTTVLIILIIAIIIVFVVLLLSVLTTSKAYKYKHTIDPIKDNPDLKSDENSVGDPEVDESDQTE
ncbi:YtzI protein [Falsibacillus albus]|uniref:YtzI protein n=1 Tax=Falsibacillus albus TaxID=2478915 RepID=A0A3L7K6C3_9BACI|nr:YtzI protein [Falsibacillus albus]RLQ97849.1 YtzI protein [Falsibacillus albus]